VFPLQVPPFAPVLAINPKCLAQPQPSESVRSGQNLRLSARILAQVAGRLFPLWQRPPLRLCRTRPGIIVIFDDCFPGTRLKVDHLWSQVDRFNRLAARPVKKRIGFGLKHNALDR